MLIVAAKLVRASLATISVCRARVSIRVIFCGYILAGGRNKAIMKPLFAYLILEFALVEATALFALLMTFLLLFAF